MYAGKDGYLYGRGATDNKGPMLATIFAVHELLEEGALEVDVFFLIEGEEESGSVGFMEAVEQHKVCDWIDFRSVGVDWCGIACYIVNDRLWIIVWYVGHVRGNWRNFVKVKRFYFTYQSYMIWDEAYCSRRFLMTFILIAATPIGSARMSPALPMVCAVSSMLQLKYEIMSFLLPHVERDRLEDTRFILLSSHRFRARRRTSTRVWKAAPYRNHWWTWLKYWPT